MNAPITSVGWDNKEWKLVTDNDKTERPIEGGTRPLPKGTDVIEGDLLEDFRGETAVLDGGRAPHKENSQGKVWVFLHHDDGQPYAKTSEFYPSVFGLRWIRSDAPAPGYPIEDSGPGGDVTMEPMRGIDDRPRLDWEFIAERAALTERAEKAEALCKKLTLAARGQRERAEKAEAELAALHRIVDRLRVSTASSRGKGSES